MIVLVFPKALKRCSKHKHRCNLCSSQSILFALLLSFFFFMPAKVWAQYGGGYSTENNLFIISTVAPESLDHTQNVPPVFLPMHDLLEDQDAYLADGVIQTTALTTGWNWFSTYIEAVDPVALLQMLETTLGENGLYIESSELLSTEYLDGEWIGDLDEVGITNEQMYLIQTSTDCTIELQGQPANPDNHVATIHPEWNWVGYPCSEEMTIAEALAGFVPEDGDRIENMEDYAEYLDGEWLGLETLKPGQGFLYYSNSTGLKTLVFQTARKQ